MNLNRSLIYDLERKSGPTVDFYFKSIVNVRYISGTIPAETLNLPRIHTAKNHHMRPIIEFIFRYQYKFRIRGFQMTVLKRTEVRPKIVIIGNVQIF